MSGMDIPVAVGFAVFTCVVTVAASLVVDLLYAVVDPRVRLY
jgi:ABC-type dipeptide/oligopeptide/nickel transport system permease component